MSQQMARFWCWDFSVWHCTAMPVGKMGDAHRALGLVDVLATGAGRAIGIDPHILLRNVDLDVLVDHRIDGDDWRSWCGGGHWRQGRNPHQAVHAGFGLQPAIGVLALDQDRRRFDARALAFALFEIFDLVAMALGPARVHAHQHLGPVLAFGAAGAGMDLEIGVVAVGLAGEHGFQPQLLGALMQRSEALLGVGDHCRVAFVLGQFDQALRHRPARFPAPGRP